MLQHHLTTLADSCSCSHSSRQRHRWHRWRRGQRQCTKPSGQRPRPATQVPRQRQEETRLRGRADGFFGARLACMQTPLPNVAPRTAARICGNRQQGERESGFSPAHVRLPADLAFWTTQLPIPFTIPTAPSPPPLERTHFRVIPADSPITSSCWQLLQCQYAIGTRGRLTAFKSEDLVIVLTGPRRRHCCTLATARR